MENTGTQILLGSIILTRLSQLYHLYERETFKTMCSNIPIRKYYYMFLHIIN